jgi:RNA polymerase sigma factor (sigma-70 family)
MAADLLSLRDTAARVVNARWSGPDGEDLVQEAWARTAVAVRDRDVDDPDAYAAATAANLVRMTGRWEARRRRWAPRLWLQPTTDGPDGAILSAEEHEAMAVALDQLPDDARHLLVAHTVHGEDTASLAATTDTTPGAVAASLARARAMLRVEYVLAFRHLPRPDVRCQRVLYAISAGDRRRQLRLSAASHVARCETCAPLISGLRDRRQAGIVALIVGRFGRLARMARVAPFRPELSAAPQASVVSALSALTAAGGLVGVLVLGTAAPPRPTVPAPRLAAPVVRVAPALKATAAHRPGKKIAISRSAASGLSLPWTKFSVSSIPKSPRIVPGAASLGSVTPINVLTTLHVSLGPSTMSNIALPLVINVTKSGKNGLP